MNNEGLGENTADRSKQSIIRKRSSGYRLVSGDEHISVPGVTIIVGDESSPMPEGALERILEEIHKPCFTSSSGLNVQFMCSNEAAADKLNDLLSKN